MCPIITKSGVGNMNQGDGTADGIEAYFVVNIFNITS